MRLTDRVLKLCSHAVVGAMLVGVGCASAGALFPQRVSQFRTIEPADVQKSLGSGETSSGNPIDAEQQVLFHTYRASKRGIWYRYIEDTDGPLKGLITGVQFTDIGSGKARTVPSRQAGLFGASVGDTESSCRRLGNVVDRADALFLGVKLNCTLHVPDPSNENLLAFCCAESGTIRLLEYRLTE